MGLVGADSSHFLLLGIYCVLWDLELVSGGEDSDVWSQASTVLLKWGNWGPQKWRVSVQGHREWSGWVKPDSLVSCYYAGFCLCTCLPQEAEHSRGTWPSDGRTSACPQLFPRKVTSWSGARRKRLALPSLGCGMLHVPLLLGLYLSHLWDGGMALSS